MPVAITLPVSSTSPLVRQRVEIEGSEFVLETGWNGRASVWTMVLSDTSEQPIRAGLQLRMGNRLLEGLADSRRPLGEMVVVGRVAEPTIDSFDNGDATLLYFTAAEVAEALG